jgi:serine/threonine protein kinase
MINRRYTVLRKIGEGRSSVFLCHDKNFNKDVAVKILSNTAEKNEIYAFKDEFLSLKKIVHPNIITVYDYGTVLRVENNDKVHNEFAGSKYISSEYINGGNLLEYCTQNNCTGIDTIVSQICSALFYLHQSNMIYFDLKAENILVQMNNSQPVIKFIDFGFVQNTRKIVDENKKGTPHYIAPEILQNKKVDHRADFYSLGIMLYRLFAGEFPFDSSDELEIYKAHVEKEIDLSDNSIPLKYKPVIKRLCNKEAENRYSNALEIAEDLGIAVDTELLRKWEPVKTYVINNAVVDLKNFLLLSEPDFIKIIRGDNLSGKTSLVEEIAHNFDGVVLISPFDFQANMPHWKSFLNKILFSEYVYQYVGSFLVNRILKVIHDEPNNIMDELKSIFINLSQRVKFTIIFDDFNKYDPITIQFLMQLLPIFLVNKVRTVIIENSNYPPCAEFASPPIVRTLDPFTEEQVHTLLTKTFSDGFPFEAVTKLIYQNCDLYPGAILAFIKDLIYSHAIEFTSKGIITDNLKKKAELLKENQFIFYDSRLQDISDGEKRILEFISLFESNLTYSQIIDTFEDLDVDIVGIFEKLVDRKILIEANNRTIHFSSAGLKNYIYAQITEKQLKHRKTALRFRNSKINISKIELARQFILGEDNDSTYEVITEYLDEIARFETYKYELELLRKLYAIKLKRVQTHQVKIRLSEVYYKIGDFKSAYAILKNLLSKPIKDIKLNEKLSLRMGECLVGLGRIIEGVQVFNSLLSTIEDEKKRKEISYEIASARTYSGSIQEAEEELKKIISCNHITTELRAKSLNLLGIIEAHYKNNPKLSIKYFSEALTIYENEKMEFKQAQVTKNMGNIYYMGGNYGEAEIFWKKSLNKFLEIGNLEEEASLLNNYGVLYYNNVDLEKSAENYNRALSIYRSLGRKYGEGLGNYNLGETYLYSSEYDRALACLEKARVLFAEIGDTGELCEVLVLTGYLLKSVNDNAGLLKLYNEFKNLADEKTLSQKDLLHFNMVEALANSSGFNEVYSRLSKTKDSYYSIGEIGHFQKAAAVLSEYLIDSKKFSLLLNIITSKDFVDSIQDSTYYRAYERFLLGKISYEQKNGSLKSNLEYYEEAFAIMHECSITDLTWRIIAALAEAYMDRGNINKAVEYIHLTKSLLNHISMNIKDIRLRSLYLSSKERKSVIEKISVWEKFIK